MSSKFKKIVIAIALLLVAGYFAFDYVMHGGARDVQAEKSAFTVKSTSFFNEFSSNADLATKKYLNKPVEISGIISSIKDSIVTIDNTILCKMKDLKDISKELKTVTIKGRVVGFDDLMGEIKLDECTLSK
ncbi:hypothetical protein OX283_004535 [Flavobacterium sp. SUN052]|uniref:OB-fold protein n=1 Tax=Flavobacterium sp. SUN052 TaxID=3002441 RepID=UPI00237E639E|nr:hypothetical protein [Flavobacterium sp. SUN052]MEC4003912.1 hypothetical protein [Flavobacterium sp. SUN052]